MGGWGRGRKKSTEHNTYVVNEIREHYDDDVSLREHFVGIRVVFRKIRFVPTQNNIFVSTFTVILSSKVELILLICLLALSGE